MDYRNQTVFGLFKAKLNVEFAANSLLANGFALSDISVLLPAESGAQNIHHVKGSKFAFGALVGATAGALLLGFVGLILSLGLYNALKKKIQIA